MSYFLVVKKVRFPVSSYIPRAPRLASIEFNSILLLLSIWAIIEVVAPTIFIIFLA